MRNGVFQILVFGRIDKGRRLLLVVFMVNLAGKECDQLLAMLFWVF